MNSFLHSSSIFAAYQRHLREKLEDLLMEVPFPLCIDVRRSLSEKGKLLCSSQAENAEAVNVPVSGIWSLLTLLIAQQVNPLVDLTYASTVSIAVECLICALDLLDDVEDEDQTAILVELGPARALNVSTALLALAQRAILSVSHLASTPDLSLRLLNTIQEELLVATVAQHRDLLAEQRLVDDMTREECIEIAAGKAGSLMRLACSLGAMCSGASEQVMVQFAQFGELFGIFQQLDNDCHDLYYLLQDVSQYLNDGETQAPKNSSKSDLVRGKKTLPIVLAAQRRKGEGGAVSREQDSEYLRSLQEGVITAWGICLLYRERTRECLQAIDAQHPVPPALRQLLQFD